MNENRPEILVVDDEPDICWALENILRPEGYTVVTSDRGKEALELIVKEIYPVVFIDAKLPDLDGLELASIIHERFPHIRIVLISGYFYREDQTIIKRLKENLFYGFIAKPFNLEEIRTITHKAMEL